jgi:branched-chain amino acid transport system substrate-binding protein
VVGWHNLEGGAVSLPDVRKGFEAGMRYVNEELGGINGHPMEAVLCNTELTPESSVNCANKFVDEGVVAAVQGVDFTSDAALPVLKEAGVVDIVAFAAGPGANVAVGDVYVTELSIQEGFGAGLVQLQALGAKSVTYLLIDLPWTHSAVDDVIKPAAKKLGLKVEVIFFPPSGADWATLAATAVSKSADAIQMFAGDADCLAGVPAIRGAGFTGLLQPGVCNAFIEQVDERMLENIIVSSPLYVPQMSPLPAKVKADLKVFDRYMEMVHPDYNKANTNQVLLGFHTAVQAADMLRQVPGELTATSVKKNIGKAKGSAFLRTNEYDCAAPTWPGTTACGSGFIFAKIRSDKSLEVLEDQPVDVSGIKPAG